MMIERGGDTMKNWQYHYTFTERSNGDIREGYVSAASEAEARDRFMAVKGACVAEGTELKIRRVVEEDHLKSRCAP